MSYIHVPGEKGPGVQTPSYDIAEELTEGQEIKIFAKQMLINRFFLGHYKERRFVESLGSYRDVVVVTESEYDLQRDLCTVRKRLTNFYTSPKTWVGITGPDCVGAPAECAVWVKLHNLAFGHYWFQIRQVKFVDNEMILRLKCARPVDVTSTNTTKFSESEGVEGTRQETSETGTANADSGDNWDKVKQKWGDIMEEIMTNFVSVITLPNAKRLVRFMAVLIVACVTGILHSVRCVGDYSLQVMREISVFIQASTPICIAVIEFAAKCVGGFYLLIAMVWRGASSRHPHADWQPHKRALPMPPKMNIRRRT